MKGMEKMRMRALLMKDYYALCKQIRIYLLFVLCFALVPDTNMADFSVIYAGMLPFSALIYDELSKWDQLAVTMPYTRRELVLSKYVLGYLACGIALVLCLAISGITTALHLPIGNRFAPDETLLVAALGPIFVAVTLPLMYRLGAEKGRMMAILAMGVFGGCVVGLLTVIPEELTQADTVPAAIIVAAWGLGAALNVVSIWLSEKWYGYKKR